MGRALTKHWRDRHTVCIYSRSESAQAALEPHQNVRRFIGDVRDRDRLRRAMGGCDVVIHAAALKRVETGQYNTDEMVKTNVAGTINVIEAAREAHVQRVVYVSTDKAWRPINVYGQSKAIAEQLILGANHYSRRTAGTFVVCRYGNVMGSTGSVIPTWRAAHGAKVRLTDPEATRFWMSIDEAVTLVAGAVNDYTHELIIPWLPAFRLGDLAHAMGVDYDIVGLPAWEKQHEGLSDMNTSDSARRMTIDEIRQRLKEIP